MEDTIKALHKSHALLSEALNRASRSAALYGSSADSLYSSADNLYDSRIEGLYSSGLTHEVLYEATQEGALARALYQDCVAACKRPVGSVPAALPLLEKAQQLVSLASLPNVAAEERDRLLEEACATTRACLAAATSRKH